jgi:hypothetical protein
MKDNLKRFVRDNREEFDTHEPKDDLWEKICAQLPESKLIEAQATQIQVPPKTGRFPFSAFTQLNWRVAASVALVIGLGWTAYTVNHQYALTEQPEVALNSPSYARQVSQYTELVENKRAELRDMTESDPALYKEFAVELDQLERSYQNLKADLPKNPNQEVVIQAMIQNLEWQIDLLNQQLNVLQRIKQSKNNHEKDKKPVV